MTRRFAFRIKIYKHYLRRLMKAKKESAYQQRLTKPTAKEIGIWARMYAPGVAFTNVARDIRRVTEPGEDYDPEFDLLLRGQVVPNVIDRYSEKFLAHIIKGIIAPCDMDERLEALVRTRPDGRRIYEEL